MYAEIILPLALEQSYHYQLKSTAGQPAHTLVGCRAVVSFGKKRFYTGVIARVYEELPEELKGRQVKQVEGILDEKPLVSSALLALWHWMADYYMCSLGQVMRTAMPGGLLPESKTLIYAYEDFEAEQPLPELDCKLLDALRESKQAGLTLQALQTRVGQSISRSYQRLLALGAIHTEETVVSRYRPRTKPHLRLSESYRSAEAIESLYTELRRARRQQEML
ncbi:MAG: primosomal protein N', partial [Porphyromonas sp.]|nr:primosomal protein N' [Porphyromonas sp.]